MQLSLGALWPKPLSLDSMRGRLALLLALAFLPAGIIAFQAGQASLSARDMAVQSERAAAILGDLSQARDDVTQLRESVRTLAANAGLFADNRRDCQGALSRFGEELGADAVVTILDEQGVIRCSNVAAATGQSTAANPLILEARLSDDVALGYIPAPRLSAEPVLAAVAPIADTRSEALFVGVTRPLAPMLTVVDPDVLTSGGFVALATRGGDMLSARGIEADSRDGEALAARFREGPAAIEAAFPINLKWAVALPIEDRGDLFLVAGWTPASEGLAGLARAAWALFAPLALWLAAVGATWVAIEHFVAQPLSVVESLARAYARGEDSEADEALLHGAPTEIKRLRRTLAAMAKTLRGREARLAVALQEERALLLEVNHRVKNNLQLVASILSIQSRAAAEAAEARGLSRAHERVQLLALAHAQIYGSGAVRDIAVDRLAADVARAICTARGDTVRLDLHLTPVRANADRAVPLAFLIGESISSLLDLTDEGASLEALTVSLAALEEGGFALELDAQALAAAGAPQSAVSQRLVGAFARQIGASLIRDADRPYFVRIEAPGVAAA
jgi:two-component sensor histidine kinase